MTVLWFGSREESPKVLLYQQANGTDWLAAKPHFQKLDRSSLTIYSTKLTHLKPSTLYRFRFEQEGPVHLFKTLPETLSEHPVKVVIGGDIFLNKGVCSKMNQTALALDPDFAILGGDIAYAGGLHEKQKQGAEQWRAFFKQWAQQMMTAEGRVIPLVPVIGNHDCDQEGSLFGQIFDQDLSYRTLQIGQLVFFLLDTGHLHPIEGAQTQWLQTAFEKHKHALYKLPIYHIAAYPSVYPFGGKKAEKIRSAWVPLFERAGVRLCFEHHNHAFKRTFPLKGGKIDPEGITFVGDGSWGVSPRITLSAWYLKKALPINAVWFLEATAGRCMVSAFDLQGKKLEEFFLTQSSMP
jgi:hypothetical protein